MNSISLPLSAPSVSKNRTQLIGLGILLVCATIPFFLGDYRLFQAMIIMSYVISLCGLNLLAGYSGQISIGHGAVFALGAYVTAIAQFHFGLPLWIALPLAALVSLVVGWLFAFPIMRLEGMYLGLASFSLALAVPQLLKVSALQGWTGGVSGITLNMPQVPFGLPISQMDFLFYLILGVTAAVFVPYINMTRGDSGRAMRAIRNHPLVASTMGIDVPAYKRRIFAISCLYTGLGGAFFALATKFVGPDSFGIFVSISFLVGVCIGGLGYIWGPVFGGLFIFFVPSVTEKISQGASYFLYGLLLILVIYLIPTGISGLVASLWAKARGGPQS